MIKFWPFPILRNNRTSSSLSRLFLEFAAAADLEVVKTESHHTVVRCSRGELRFWSANAYYAWANVGELLVDGREISWQDEMPSRYAVRSMRKAIERVRFPVPSREEVTV